MILVGKGKLFCEKGSCWEGMTQLFFFFFLFLFLIYHQNLLFDLGILYFFFYFYLFLFLFFFFLFFFFFVVFPFSRNGPISIYHKQLFIFFESQFFFYLFSFLFFSFLLTKPKKQPPSSFFPPKTKQNKTKQKSQC